MTIHEKLDYLINNGGGITGDIDSFTQTAIYQECINANGSFTVQQSGWYLVNLKMTGANQYTINGVVHSIPDTRLGSHRDYYPLIDVKYFNKGDVCRSYKDLNALCIVLLRFD